MSRAELAVAEALAPLDASAAATSNSVPTSCPEPRTPHPARQGTGRGKVNGGSCAYGARVHTTWCPPHTHAGCTCTCRYARFAQECPCIVARPAAAAAASALPLPSPNPPPSRPQPPHLLPPAAPFASSSTPLPSLPPTASPRPPPPPRPLTGRRPQHHILLRGACRHDGPARLSAGPGRRHQRLPRAARGRGQGLAGLVDAHRLAALHVGSQAHAEGPGVVGGQARFRMLPRFLFELGEGPHAWGWGWCVA